MTLELLTEHHFEFPSLKGGCTGSSESTLVKMQHCWKSHVVAHIVGGEITTIHLHLLFDYSGLTFHCVSSDSDLR